VNPETVVGWHRAGFRLYWRWRSRPRGGRPKVSARTVARYLKRVRRRDDPGKNWRAFLANHRETIVAMDFFTVPTLGFKLLYGFFVIEHSRRHILHFNITSHPSSEWVVQQLREAFPEAGPYRYLILDRDTKFDADVIGFLKATGLKPKRTSVQSPWQNGTAEGWAGSCRREILDHFVPLHEEHLRRLIRDYVNYYHDDRIHDSLEKDTPNRRPVESKPSPTATVISNTRPGGLHHRYGWREAA
jgi:putative transposase